MMKYTQAFLLSVFMVLIASQQEIYSMEDGYDPCSAAISGVTRFFKESPQLLYFVMRYGCNINEWPIDALTHRFFFLYGTDAEKWNPYDIDDEARKRMIEGFTERDRLARELGLEHFVWDDRADWLRRES